MSYDTVDNVVRMIQRYDQGSVLGKTNVEHEYKLIPIHRDDIPALGMRWWEDGLWNATLPMGIRSGFSIFDTFSSAVQFFGRGKELWTNESCTG